MSRKPRGYQPPVADADEIRRRFDRVRQVWRRGQKISAYEEKDATVLEVRLVESDAVLIFDWPDSAKPLGLHIDLNDVTSEFYYGAFVESFDEWIEFLDVYVMVSLGTGVVNRSAQLDRGDYIGIREHNG